MNVYVRDLSRELGRRGVGVDVFTRSQDDHVPHVLHDLGYGNRIVHVRAGPETPLPKEALPDHLGEFVAGVDFARPRALATICPQPLLAPAWRRSTCASWGSVVQMFHAGDEESRGAQR
jgi:D-inositol-3-phosphate glycosyltransferase